MYEAKRALYAGGVLAAPDSQMRQIVGARNPADVAPKLGMNANGD